MAAGYQRVKIKIKPGWDIEVLERVRERFPRLKLMADANSAYTLADKAHLKLLDRFYLMMLEQPLAHDDLIDHARLQQYIETPVCLDESIRTLRHAEQAIELAACRIINIKLGRVGGFAAARAIHDCCQAAGIPVWCGGMLESGIGRAANIALSTLPDFVLPGDVSASRRYWTEDVIHPEVVVTPRGTIEITDAPGTGYEADRERIERLTVRAESFSKRKRMTRRRLPLWTRQGRASPCRIGPSVGGQGLVERLIATFLWSSNVVAVKYILRDFPAFPAALCGAPAAADVRGVACRAEAGIFRAQRRPRRASPAWRLRHRRQLSPLHSALTAPASPTPSSSERSARLRC